MFIIIDIEDGIVSVLDTRDGVIEKYSRDEILEFNKKVPIYGVPKKEGELWGMQSLGNVVSSLIKKNRIDEAVISLQNDSKIKILFKSKPTDGAMHFVKHRSYTWCKREKDNWSRMEDDLSSTYRGGMSDIEVIQDIQYNCNFYIIDSIKICE